MKTRTLFRVSKLAGVATFFVSLGAYGAVDQIPNAALVPSNSYYTDSIGGGIGNVVVMTDGGNAPGVGDPTGRNDDGFSGPINLGFSVPFFGQTYNQLWINNNGSVSFNNGIAEFTPSGPQGASEPIISPFFADADSRGSLSGVVHLRTDIPDEVIVTWDQIGYFESHDDKLNSFQLVLRGPNFLVPTGEGSIGFFYKNMQWETGNASGGVDGFGGTPAAIGFGDGQSNGSVLEASLKDGVSTIASNEHIWFTPNLVVVPEPSTVAVMLAGLGMLAMSLRLRARRN